ncbi:MAG TPA: ATP-dependent DNA ligase [Candidatus Binatia bacterium]|nr:ATP-dependent DNA ligase [Candidatus Binatia bacterium]
MEARLVDEIPTGPDWQYEPKWDGFRCLAFRDGDAIELQSRSGQTLTRYFPEVVENLRAVSAPTFVLDGELVVPADGRLSFDDLLQRIHPAASRVRKLAAERPAVLIVFDLLVDETGRLLVSRPLRERRPRLERFASRHLADARDIRLSPATPDPEAARGWLGMAGAALDGVVAKRLDLPYRSGDRTGMQKVKRVRTADCVVGGFRYASGSRTVGSLLLGLYDAAGLLHHVGFTSAFSATARKTLVSTLTPLIRPPGFTGRAPGGPSRWSTSRSSEWEPLAPKLVAEVSYDHFTGGRFRHGTGFLRWRPDKPPRQCTMDQVEPAAAPPVADGDGARRASTTLAVVAPDRARSAPRAPARAGRAARRAPPRKRRAGPGDQPSTR